MYQSESDPVINIPVLKENPQALTWDLHGWFKDQNLKLWNFWLAGFALHDLMLTVQHISFASCA